MPNPTSNMKRLLVFILLLVVTSGCQKSIQCEKEIYLLPEGFRGKMIVFFDQPDGEVIQYEDSTRVYAIPSSGYLRTQFPRNGGCMNDDRIKFFYVDSLGTREPLDYFLNLPKDSLPKDRDYVVFTFLSNPESKPDFVVHLIGGLYEFNELTQSMHLLQPVKILDSLNNH